MRRTAHWAGVNLYLRLVALLARLPLRGRIAFWDTAVTPFRVWPTDLDIVGHVTNAKYLAMLDVGRIDLMMRSEFWKRINDQGWYPVVAAQTIRYRHSLTPRQKFTLHTRFIGFDEKAMYFDHEFRVGDVVHSRAIAQTRMLRKGGGHVSSAEVRELVTGMPELKLPDWVNAWAATVREGL